MMIALESMRIMLNSIMGSVTDSLENGNSNCAEASMKSVDEPDAS